MRVVYAGMRVEFSTRYRIDAAKWDNWKQRVKNGCTNKLKQTASEINADLLQYYTDVQTIFKQFEVKGTTPTPEQLKQAFNVRNNKPEPEEITEASKVDFMAVFDEFVTDSGNRATGHFLPIKNLQA